MITVRNVKIANCKFKIVDFSASLLILSFFKMYFETVITNIQIKECYIFQYIDSFDPKKYAFLYPVILLVLNSTSSDVNTITSTFLCLLFAWNIIFHPFYFQLVSLYFNLTTAVDTVNRSYFLIQYDILCLLIGLLRLQMSKRNILKAT